MTDQNEQLRVGGMQPLTLIDFPGHLSSVLFLQGCNLRCRFCYNRTLLPEFAPESISFSRAALARSPPLRLRIFL